MHMQKMQHQNSQEREEMTSLNLHTKKRGLKRLIAGVTATGVVAMSLVGGMITSANAATYSTKFHKGYSQNDGGGRYTVGSDKIGDYIAYCLDINYYPAAKYSTGKIKTGIPNGASASDVSAANYLLNKYGKTTSNVTAAATANAIWYFLSSKKDLSGSHGSRINQIIKLLPNSVESKVKSKYKSLVAEAKKYGVKSASMSTAVDVVQPADKTAKVTTGTTVTNIKTKLLNGSEPTVAPGSYDVKLTLSGAGASFASGSKVTTKTVKNGASVKLYNVGKNQSVKVSAAASGLKWGSKVKYFYSSSSSKQRMALADIITSSLSASDSDKETWKTATPVVPKQGANTTASDDVRSGNVVYDTLHVNDETAEDADNHWLGKTYAQFELYKIADTINATIPAEVPAGLTPVFTSVKNIESNGDLKSDEYTVPEGQSGTYAWRATVYKNTTVDENDSTPDTSAPVADPVVVKRVPLNDPGENLNVFPSPTVTTQASDDVLPNRNENGDREVYDTATVTGHTEDGDTITFALHKYSDEQGSDETPKCTDENTVYTSTPVAVDDGAGEYQSPSYKPVGAKSVGSYVWVEIYKDKNGKVLAQGDCTEKTEQFKVTPPPAPTVTTQASESVKVGEKINDTVTVSGDESSIYDGDHVVVRAYRLSDEILDADQQEAADLKGKCTPENLLFTSDKINITATGDYTSNDYITTAGGTIGFQESYYRDGSDTPIAVGECGTVSENVTVSYTPEISTTASKGGVVGTEIHDTAHLTKDAEPGSTVVFELYKLSDDANAKITEEKYGDGTQRLAEGGSLDVTPAANTKCTPDNKVWTSEKVSVHNSGDYKSGSFKTTSKGKYGYVETLYGPDGKTILAKGNCGVGKETVSITPKPVTTTPKTELATTGTGMGVAGLGIGGALAVLAGAAAMYARKRANAGK